MKFKKIFLLIFFLLSSFDLLANQNPSQSTKFIVLGHTYPINNDFEKINKLINKINSYQPDYVFILGDANLDDVKFFNKYKSLLKSKVFFSPGNHEYKNKDNYLNNVGYLNKLIIEKDIQFILLDSNDDINNIKKNLNVYLNKKFDIGPTIILTHHRIWDDSLISYSGNHDKSFYFDEIYLLIKDKVDYIFSGNSKRQYFRDLTDNIGYGKQNTNVIYWLDKIGNIQNLSVGMGDGAPKATFVVAEVVNGKLLIQGDYISDENSDILSRSLLVKNELKLNKKYNKQNYYFINKKKLFYLFVAIFIILILFFFYKYKFKNF